VAVATRSSSSRRQLEAEGKARLRQPEAWTEEEVGGVEVECGTSPAGRDARWRQGAALAEVRLRPGGAGRSADGGEVEARVWSSGGEAREEEG
jgi:hypothetical protein